jgi:hypothetical protein
MVLALVGWVGCDLGGSKDGDTDGGGTGEERFVRQADVLFVADKSSSMQDESLAIANGARALLDTLRAGADGVHLAVTTSDVAADYGRLYGDDPLLDAAGHGAAIALNRNLLCSKAVYLRESDVPSDPTYTCADDPEPDGEISREYLDCLCGADWANTSTGGTEEPLEALYMAACRAVEAPPAACFDPIDLLEASDTLSNEGLFRAESRAFTVIFTDEGDASRRMTTGDADPDEYATLLSAMVDPTFLVIGPTPSECNHASATAWGVARLEWFASDSGGTYVPIAENDGSGGCVSPDFEAVMGDLGSFIRGTNATFALAGTPDPATLMVTVDGSAVPEDATEGWTYDAASNAVVFTGDAAPGYGAEVVVAW